MFKNNRYTYILCIKKVIAVKFLKRLGNTNGYSDEVWPNCKRVTCVHRGARCLREKSDIPRTLRGFTQFPIVVLLSTRAAGLPFSCLSNTPLEIGGCFRFFFCIYQNITRVHAAAWGRSNFPYTSPRDSGNFFGLKL